MRLIATCLLSGIVLAACTTRGDAPSRGHADQRVTSTVGFQDISDLTSAPNGRLSLAANESYLEPLEATDSPMPPYPADLLGSNLDAQTVCLRVAVGVDGTVASAVPLTEPPACPAPVDPAFSQAASRTVMAWAFEPARRCVFPTAAIKELAIASCNGGEETPIAVTLTYRFVFEQNDGTGTVRLGM